MLGEPIDRKHPALRTLRAFEEARLVRQAGPRLRQMRAAAERVRVFLRQGPTALTVRTLPLTTLMYPTRYAFNGAALSPAPYVQLTHRALLVQVRGEGQVRTLLFNPTDYRAARQTPFLAQLIRTYGSWVTEHLLTRAYGTIAEQLERLGIGRDQVDLVAFDHLHTQDLRPLLGTTGPEGQPPLFPNAELLIQRAEWEETLDPHPIQAPWYVPGGLERVRTDRVVFLDGDVSLGEGVLLLATPGHTAGNHSLVLHTDTGVWVTSENGVATECYSPLESRIPGVRSHARRLGHEVVLNGNTIEGGTDQYTSMVVERTLADPTRDAPGFFNVFPSSELTTSPLSPGVAPTYSHREITSGSLVREARPVSGSAAVSAAP